jgi:hypothetical protein
VDQDGDAGYSAQRLLRFGQAVPGPHLGDAGQRAVLAPVLAAPVVAGLAGGDDDAAHPLGGQRPGQRGDRHRAGRVLPAGHRDRGVVQQLVRDVGAAGDGRPHGQAVIFHNALDIMDVVRKLVAEGWLITADQLGAMSPYIRAHISRFGAYATDDLARQPEAFNPVLKEVDFTALGLAA